MLWVYGHYKVFIISVRGPSGVGPRAERFNPLAAKLFNLNFHPPEVVSR